MNKPRLLELDALRGIAALGVVLFHYMVAFVDHYDHGAEIFPGFRYFRYGKHGVELFFIISGFVIFMSLERTKRSNDFIFGRFSRLYPTYWAAVILSFVIVTFANLPDLRINLRDALINLTMFQQFFNVPHIDGNYWTLEIEFSFYIIMLLLWRVKLLKQIDFVAISWLSIASINLLLERVNIVLLDSRISAFLILDYAHLFITGILLYRIFVGDYFLKRKYTIIFTCILFGLFKHGTEPMLFHILFLTLFLLIIGSRLTFITWKPLLFLGTISYSLYLTHLYVGLVEIKLLEKLGININACILIALLLSLIVATTITFVIEKPALKLMRHQYDRLQKTKV